MKEANIFEAWANTLMEGTWQLPDTPEKQAKLVQLMSQDLPVGADATNATEQLYDLLGDDILFDKLEELAERDANADARQVIYDRMQELSDHPDVLKVINQFQVDADATMEPPEATNPADLEPADEVEEAVKDPYTQTEDPAGTPQPKYPEYQADLASILKHAGVPAQERPAPDYELEMTEAEEETDEGWKGALAGQVAGDVIGGPVGGVIGSLAGDKLGDLVSGDNKEETDEGNAFSKAVVDAKKDGIQPGETIKVGGKEYPVKEEETDESPLQGQYGHSGKLKAVDKDHSFLDRLKELSGMIRN